MDAQWYLFWGFVPPLVVLVWAVALRLVFGVFKIIPFAEDPYYRDSWGNPIGVKDIPEWLKKRERQV